MLTAVASGAAAGRDRASVSGARAELMDERSGDHDEPLSLTHG